MKPEVGTLNSGKQRARVAERDQLVREHMSLAEGIARGVARSLPPSFDVEDLIQTGYVALMAAATRYRPGDHGGTPFSAFARPSIRGAILDSVRRRHYVENTRPSIAEVAPMAAPSVIETEIDAGRLARRLREAVSWLPRDERRVLAAYYGAAEPTLPAVAARLGVSPRRTRRMHASAIEGIRRRFRIAA